ncbi:ClpXP protease specificity-enhancing factor SspB [Pelagibacteraceae bacterium]|nr:ClpXP protease specificity-enhancing factor SspB [Pelagibacteraceae bacterium]
MIDYKKILNKNMLNVFIDILKNISKNGLSQNNHLYITFLTNHINNKIPQWLKQKYPNEITIVIQYEFYDLEVRDCDFSITLSFNDIQTKLKIDYGSILSFADPSSNFGLILQKNKTQKIKNQLEKSNVINFSNFKKN